MPMQYKLFAACLIIILGYNNLALAVGSSGSCNDSSDCDPGLYCTAPHEFTGSTCSECINANNIDSASYISPGNDNYSGDSNKQNTCSWYILVAPDYKWNANTKTTEACNSDPNHQTLTAPEGFVVYYNGAIPENWARDWDPGYGYQVEIGKLLSDNNKSVNAYYFFPLNEGQIEEVLDVIPGCVARPYKVSVNCADGRTSNHTYCNTDLYRQYDNKVDWFYDYDDVSVGNKITTNLEIPTKNCAVFNGFYDTNNTMVFSATGVSQTTADNPIITEPTTITAQWNAANYTIRIYNGNNLLNKNTGCDCDNSQCSANITNVSTFCADGQYISGATIPSDSNYAVCGNVSVSNDTTITFNMTNKNGCPIYQNGTPIDINLTISECPAGYYCTGCHKEQCPNNKSSDAGAKSDGECYYGQTTQFRDSRGTFTLPVGSGGKIYTIN